MNLDEAMYTFGTGENFHLQNYLGVHELEGEEGFIFRVWAPHAEQIQVIGDFTGWFDEPLDMTKNISVFGRQLQLSQRKDNSISSW